MLASVTAPKTRLMREPAKNTQQETELLFGHQFHIEDKIAGWAYGREMSPFEQDVAGYAGWIKLKDLNEKTASTTHYISALKAPVFKKQDIKSRVKSLLPMGAQVRVKKSSDKFAKIAGGSFVHVNHIRPLGDYAQNDFVSAAAAHLGLPYLWAGVSTDGLDCSGLVQSSLRAVGRDCLRDAGQQETSLGKGLPEDETLRRGDLIFWPGHVGIMIDATTLIHANAFHMCVATEPLETATTRIGKPRHIARL